MRITAVDVPNQLSLHYSGAVHGPVSAFGFDLGDFAEESSHMLMTDAFLTTARTQVCICVCVCVRFLCVKTTLPHDMFMYVCMYVVDESSHMLMTGAFLTTARTQVCACVRLFCLIFLCMCVYS